jgi:glycosyltransferase involved in cell wall biosynthesis
MRLLVLTPEFDGAGGGIITFYRMLAPALRASGVDVRIIEGSAFHAAECRSCRSQDGVQLETLEADRLSRWVERFHAYAATPTLRRHLAAAWAMWEQAGYGADADIVEATDWGLLFIPPAVQAILPLVVQCHGSIGQIADHDPNADATTENLFVRLIERDVLSRVGTVQTLSQANTAFWRAETGRVVGKIPPAWAMPDILNQEEPSARGLVVGRMQLWKGPGILCEALRRLGSRAPNIDWIGRDTAWGTRSRSAAKHLAQTYRDVWQTKLSHHPPISPEEVAYRQARALINIVPSTWDVFNFTVVEAMASGRPTIVSSGAGASELIDDGVNGYLFANENADALAGTIERVLSKKPARLKEIGREAQNTIRTALNPRTIVIQRLAAYRAAIDAFNAQQLAPIGGWLGRICRPSEIFGSEMAFLENLPLRTLAKHVLRRISQRVRKR